MPRGARLVLDEAIFHIINRGNARQEVFDDKEDFKRFLSIVARYKDKFGFKLYHFCLMPNHIHLLLETPKAEILSKAMQGITLSYTQYHHAKKRTIGYLWQGRFKNMLINKEKYLMICGAYIERNPKRANLVEKIEDWPYSSFRFYAYGEEMKIPIITEKGVKKLINLIDSNPYIQNMNKDLEEQRKNYRSFVDSMDDPKTKEQLLFQDGGVLGSEKFRKKIKYKLEKVGIKFKPGEVGRPKQEEN